MQTTVPPLKGVNQINRQAAVINANDSDATSESSESSLNSSVAAELDAGSFDDADSVDDESLFSSVGGLSSSHTSGRSSKKGASTTDSKDGDATARQPLLERLLHRRRKDLRSHKVTREIKRKKERLDEMYAVARQSYFDKTCCARFSLMNEFRCVRDFAVRFYLTLEEERLPWLTDFADPKKMRLPHKFKEVSLRLNLNIPYYSSNYLEIFYALTLPFLFLYNPQFLAMLAICTFLVHTTSARKRVDNEYGDCVMLLGHSIHYRTVGHIVLALLIIAIFFFHGLQTIAYVLLLNGIVVIPHAVWRRPTFFDDEELEKCRPKLIQYFITAAVTMLVYLEGDTEGREADGFHAAQRRRAKLGLPIIKLEDDPYVRP